MSEARPNGQPNEVIDSAPSERRPVTPRVPSALPKDHNHTASNPHPIEEEPRSMWTSSEASPESQQDGLERRWYRRAWRRPSQKARSNRLSKQRFISKPSNLTYSTPLDSNGQPDRHGRLPFVTTEPDKKSAVWQNIKLKERLRHEKKRADHIEQKYKILLEKFLHLGHKSDEKLKSQELKLSEAYKKLEVDARDKAAEVPLYKSEASRQRKYTEHWKRLYEREAGRVDSLQKQLEITPHPRSTNLEIPDLPSSPTGLGREFDGEMLAREARSTASRHVGMTYGFPTPPSDESQPFMGRSFSDDEEAQSTRESTIDSDEGPPIPRTGARKKARATKAWSVYSDEGVPSVITEVDEEAKAIDEWSIYPDEGSPTARTGARKKAQATKERSISSDEEASSVITEDDEEDEATDESTIGFEEVAQIAEVRKATLIVQGLPVDVDDGASSATKESWEDITDSESEITEIAYSSEELLELRYSIGSRMDDVFKETE
jgi:hypothetical protein